MTGLASPPACLADNEFGIGIVLRLTADVVTRNFGRLCLIAAPIFVLLGLAALFERVELGTSTAVIATVNVLIALVQIASQQILVLAVTYATVRSLRGRAWTVEEAFRVALARFVPVMGLIILLGVAIALGMLLFIVPGFIVMLMAWVAMPACVVERLGPISAIQRSSMLTQGHRWAIFALFFLILVASGIFKLIVVYVVATASAVVGGSSLGALNGSTIGFAVDVIAYVLWVIIGAVSYHCLWVVKNDATFGGIGGAFD